MPGHSFARAGLCAVLLALGSSGSAQAITFSDTEFADSDWTVILEDYGAPGAGGGVANGFQVGSNGNPGAYRRSEVGFATAANVTEIVINIQLREGAVFDPSTQGAIETVDLSYDVFIESSAAFGGIVLRQGGIFYYSAGQNPAANSIWQSISLPGRVSTSFGTCENLFGALCAEAGSGDPDFSSSGGPIEIGFFQAAALTSRQANLYFSRIDNWSVTVNPVPEPGTATLLLVGLALLSRTRERAR